MKLHKFEFNMFGVNTYVVWDPDTLEAAVVDPGMANPAEERELSDFISVNRLQVTTLLNTHLHIDHALGDYYVEQRYAVGLQASPDDEFLGKGLREQAMMFHLNVTVPESLRISVPLKGGDRIYLGNSWLEALEVPGHSPGSLAFYSPADDFVLTGDALFNGSVGRTDLPGGNHATLISSIHDQLLSLPLSTEVYPGHGPATTIAAELHQNPFL